MAMVLADRVKETSTTTGTSDMVLLGAASGGYRAFGVVMTTGDTTYYCIVLQSANEWEVGIGTYQGVANAITRNTVLASSNNNNPVSFGAGTKDVFITYAAGRSIYANGTVLQTTNNAVLPTASGGTGLTGFTANGVMYASGTGTLATSSALTFDGANLGLGVTPSAWNSVTKAIQLGNTGSGIWSYTSSGTSDEYLHLVNNSYLNSAGNNVYVRDGQAAMYRLFAGQHNWYNAPSGTAGNNITFTQAMTLDAAGNLGIGSTSPLLRFDASVALSAGTIQDVAIFHQVSGSNPSVGQGARIYLAANSSTTRAAAIQAQVASGTTNGHMLQFLTNADGGVPTVRATLDIAGNLGIGSTSPVSRLHVNTAGSTLSLATIGNINNGISIGTDTDGSGVIATYSGSQAIKFGGGVNGGTFGTERMRLDAAGNLGLGITPSASTGKSFNTTRAWFGSLPGGPYNHAYMSANAYPTSSADPGSAVWLYYSGVAGDLGNATRYEQRSGYHEWSVAAAGLAGATVSFTKAMVLDPSGNLGIGTSSPGYKLDVQGNGSWLAKFSAVTGTNGAYSAFANTGGNFFVGRDNSAGANFGAAYSSVLWSAGAYPMLFATNGSERMRLDSSGNLGLGITPSAWASSVRALETTTGAFYSYTSGTTSNFYMLTNAYFNGTNNIYKASNFATQYLQSAGQHIWYNAPSGTAGNAITFTQAMTLDSSGNLLVGLTSATGVAKLQVSGPLRTTGYTVAALPAGTVGMRTYVTDALAPVALATVAGGGAVTVPVFYNGSNWIVA